MPQPTDKTCASCGRRIEWRAKWAADWDQVRYCSSSCRRRGVTRQDEELEAVIWQLLEGRARSATVCPSEAARQLGGEQWRELMEPARRMVADGRVQITQNGRVVDPSTARGPIRIRRAD